MARQSDPEARTKLLEASRKIFAEKGLDRAKVEDITQLAGVSKGAFYLHFPSKDEAFCELVTTEIAHMESLIKACYGVSERHAFELKEFLGQWLRNDLSIYEYIWKNRALMQLLLGGGGSPKYQHLMDQFALRVQEHSKQLLRQGVEFGLYRADLDVDCVSAFLAGGYDRMARYIVRAKKKPNFVTMMLELQRFLIAGIGSPALIAAVEKLRSELAVEASAQRVAG